MNMLPDKIIKFLKFLSLSKQKKKKLNLKFLNVKPNTRNKGNYKQKYVVINIAMIG